MKKNPDYQAPAMKEIPFLSLTMRHPSCARTRTREATIPARDGFSLAEALCQAFPSVYPRSVT